MFTWSKMYTLFIFVSLSIFLSVILTSKAFRVTSNVVFRRTGAGGECVIDPDDDGQWPGHNPPIIIDEVIFILIQNCYYNLGIHLDWQLHSARQEQSEVHHRGQSSVSPGLSWHQFHLRLRRHEDCEMCLRRLRGWLRPGGYTGRHGLYQTASVYNGGGGNLWSGLLICPH